MKHSVQDIVSLHLSSINPEDFFLLLSCASRKSKEYLIAHPEHRISEVSYRTLVSLIQRRINHEPIALITGHKEFYGFNFSVNQTTLVPRPETESLVELALKDLDHHTQHLSSQHAHIPQKPLALIDVGTGSGNILLSILKTIEKKLLSTKFSCFGLDISREAITLAKKNAHSLHPLIRARFLQSDLLQAIPVRTFRRFASVHILANLPYLKKEIYQRCPPDVKEYEPESALLSEAQGCAHIERLLGEIAVLHSIFPDLPFNIWLEISPEQATLLPKRIRRLLPASRFDFQKDITQKYRFVHITLHA
ncbi:MAG: peptide chain release factor N(5)-glutamine methyltransferase [Candidatus Moranbacteria bacterium]|nr:peptide chain release factor N(5)-glutamine methyltransferase [Candidatus Moranbacteria bacterium]